MERTGRVEQARINPEQWFEERQQENQQLTQKYKKLGRAVSWSRVAAFLSTLALPALLLPVPSLSFFLLTLLLLTIFLSLVALSSIIDRKLKHHKALYEFSTTELQALRGNFHDFAGDGSEYSNTAHNFNYDLDIFGRGSIFQRINRTCSPEGRDRLAGFFNHPVLDANEIESRQKILAELSMMPGFREEFYALMRVNAVDAPISDRLKSMTESLATVQTKAGRILTTLFPIATLIVITAVATSTIPASTLLYLFFTGLTISGIYFNKVNKCHNLVSRLSDLLNSYSQLFALVASTVFTTVMLDQISRSLGKQNKESASSAVKKLALIVKSFDLRLNPLMAAVLNGFMLWDIRQSIRVSRWTGQYGHSMADWFDSIHQLEAYNSLAGYMFANPHFCTPQTSQEITLKATNMGHPMIDASKRVCNDFSLSHSPRIVILTGANMAGKSTFLRTVGINYLLATMGCTVCSSGFIFKPLPLITNMRTSDSLLREESYFFAELKRLKLIVTEIQSKGEHLFILDEILKGTNSIDKAKGSKALINKLLAIGGTGLVATHDLELGQLAEIHHQSISNNCFEVTQKDGELIFDYILRKGVTSSHNATYLMKKMGLMDED